MERRVPSGVIALLLIFLAIVLMLMGVSHR